MTGAEEQHPRMTTEEITGLIRRARGMTVERDSLYRVLQTHQTGSDPERV
jgi:hypothetical protein